MTETLVSQKINISVFEHAFAKTSKLQAYGLESFTALLTGAPEYVDVPAHLTPMSVGGDADAFKLIKAKGRAWSPACFGGDTNKLKVNVTRLPCLPLDFDKGRDGGAGLPEDDVDALFDWLSASEYRYVWHTSFTSGYCADGRTKLRVVLFFERDVSPAEYARMWSKIEGQLPVKPDGSRDAPCAIYFLPRIPRIHAGLYECGAGGLALLKISVLPIDLNKGGPKDFLSDLRNAENKEPALNRAAFGLAEMAGFLGEPLDGDKIWADCRKALEDNKVSSPVQSWAAAEATARDAARDGHKEGRGKEGRWNQKERDVLNVHVPEGFEASAAQLAKAELALTKAVKTFLKDTSNIFAYAVSVGRFVPHIISRERAQKELFDAAAVNFKKGVVFKTGGVSQDEATTKIAAGLAAGGKRPYGGKSTGWDRALLQDDNGPVACEENAKVILEKHPALEGNLGWNVRKKLATLASAPPWDHTLLEYPSVLEEDCGYDVGGWLAKQMGGRPLGSASKAYAALQAAARTNEYDPFKAVLEAAQWDGVKRIDTCLIDHAAAADSPYTRLVTRKFLLQVVARTYEPGCKVDHVLVLVGEQGLYKSMFFESLVGKEFFCSNIGVIDKPDAILALEKYAIVEMPELADLDKRSVETVKRFITDNSEEARGAYRRDSRDVIRRAVFGGTTNVVECLRDATGGRRFWPVVVPRVIDYKAVEADRSQLWAEALFLYRGGEQWWPTGPEYDLCRAVQEEHTDHDDLLETLNMFQGKALSSVLTERGIQPAPEQVDPDSGLFRWVPVSQVYQATGLDITKRADQNRVKALAAALKWKKTSRWTGSAAMKVFLISRE